jgi:ribosomal protein L37AE/L43A
MTPKQLEEFDKQFGKAGPEKDGDSIEVKQNKMTFQNNKKYSCPNCSGLIEFKK